MDEQNMERNMGQKILLIIITIIVFLTMCTPEEKVTPQAKRNIVLVNPSTWSLNSFLYLVKNKIVDIDDVSWRVVYDSKSDDRYRGGQNLLNKYPSLTIQLEILPEELKEEQLFQENELTDDFRNIYRASDGMLFFGGGDIPPASYGEKTKLLTGIDTPHRHFFELSLIFHLLGGYQNENMVPFLEEKPGYVVYGFCLGMQTLNVATGGTMIQDIPSEVYNLDYIEDIIQLDPNQMHHNYWKDLYAGHGLSSYQFHQIKLLPGQFWIKDLQMETDFQPYVYSNHHQALEKIGKGFVASATSLDKRIIESIQHNTFQNVMGVQFHPENYQLYQAGEKNYKFSPADSVHRSAYEILEKYNSLEFHKSYWRYFSGSF
jgi:putative glutamine amidotransferase